MTLDALWWYLSIFLWLFLTGLGVPPCPEEAGILYAAGLTSLHPEVHWWGAWPATMAGIVCADMALYGIGRRWGDSIFRLAWVRRVVPDERRQRIETRFHGHGMKILLTARFLPPLRTGVFIIAGAIRYPFARFLAADATYAVVGVGIFFFGSAGLIEALRWAGHWAVYAVAAAAIAFGLYEYYRYLKKRELKGAAAPPVSVLELPPVPVGRDSPPG